MFSIGEWCFFLHFLIALLLITKYETMTRRIMAASTLPTTMGTVSLVSPERRNIINCSDNYI